LAYYYNGFKHALVVMNHPESGGFRVAEMPMDGCLLKATPHQDQKKKERGEVIRCGTDLGNEQCCKRETTGA